MKTVSLELSKQLKEAGYPQEDSQFKYCGGHTDYYEDQDKGKFEECENTDLLGDDEYCHTIGLVCEFTVASPTADEILEQITGRVSIDRYSNKSFSVHWMSEPMTEFSKTHMEKEETLPDTLAKLWLYLKENNLLEVKG